MIKFTVLVVFAVVCVAAFAEEPVDIVKIKEMLHKTRVSVDFSLLAYNNASF